MTERLRVVTRQSPLALWQTQHVIGLLQATHPGLQVEILAQDTQGDRELHKTIPEVGGKGVFTLELENAMREHRADIAVHSLKDMPTENSAGFVLAATPTRANPFDALVSRNHSTLAQLPKGASVGTCSPRRTAQLLHVRPDLRVVAVRGNVQTRLNKLKDLDAVVLAVAGLERLGLGAHISQVLDTSVLPAPGQGALAVQCRAGDTTTLALLTALEDTPTRLAVEAERAFLAGLGGGCSLPISAFARWQTHSDGEALVLHGRVNSPDGASAVDVQETRRAANLAEAKTLGQTLADQAKNAGALGLLQASAGQQH